MSGTTAEPQDAEPQDAEPQDGQSRPAGAPDDPEIASPAQLEYAGKFGALNNAIAACEHSEDVALLLSTCRNQWMAANAAFVDLQAVLTAGKSSERVDGPKLIALNRANPIALAVERLREGSVEVAATRLRDVVAMVGHSSTKLDVWRRREELTEELRGATETLAPIERATVRTLLSEQRRLQRDQHGRPVGEYVALSNTESAEGRKLLAILERAHAELAAATHALLEAALYEERRRAQADALEAAAGRDPSLFDEDDPPPSPPADPWPELVIAVTTAHKEAARGAVDVLGLTGPGESSDDAERDAFVEELLAAAERLVEEVRERLAAKLRPNRPQSPLPPPYVLDLTPRRRAMGDRATAFTVALRTGNTPEVPSRTRVGLLRCGVPPEAYQDGELYRYRRDDEVDHAARAIAIARAAIERAAADEIGVVAMPECFLPDPAAEELHELAEDRGVGVIAGIEHYFDVEGKVINEATLIMPGIPPLTQHKQRPSKDELQGSGFSPRDGVVWVIERTPLGALAVVVCSDYLQLDMQWALASHRPCIDTLVVCSRNPNPDVFTAMARADAYRLHTNVIVVNGDPGAAQGGDSASGRGTGVCWPKRDDPNLTALEQLELDVEGWPGVEPPALAVYDVTVAALSGREKGRTSSGLLDAPAFLSEEASNT